MNSIIHVLAEARFYAEEDLKIAKGLGSYDDVVDALDMLHVIGEAQETVRANDWTDTTERDVIKVIQFVKDHK